MNIDIADHYHPPTPVGEFVAPSMNLQSNLPAINKIIYNKTVESIKNHKGNLSNTITNYLSDNAGVCIRSPFNKTN